MIAFKATSGSRILPLGLALDGPFGDGKRELDLVGSEPQRLLAASAAVPSTGRSRSCDRSAGGLRRPGSPGEPRRTRNPERRLSWPRTTSLEQTISIPAFSPINRGSLWVPPQPGNSPSPTSGRPICVCGAVETRRSSMVSASSVPPPMQAPSIRATIGNGRWLIRVKS